jgi:hypothetical protein
VSYKIGIIVPYRNRFSHLIKFKNHIIPYLTSKGFDFELIIIEQDYAKTFNRGKLLNIGFKYAKILHCDYVVFHDVDMLPVDVDYSYSDIPLQLSSNKGIVSDDFFGGVTLFPVQIFEEINGYSNDYWGWGFEDNDLLYRCILKKVFLDKKEIKICTGNTASLKFNGINSFVSCINKINMTKPITLFVSFYPDDIFCTIDRFDDTYGVMGIPGFDFQISFNSYSRYNFEMYDASGEICVINTEIKPNYMTNICVTIDPMSKMVTMYQDGLLIDSVTYNRPIWNYEGQMYLGAVDPRRGDNPKYFKGQINSFAYFENILTKKEIIELSTNKNYGLTYDFGEYVSSRYLKQNYDAKFIRGNYLMDLSGNLNDGKINNCEIVEYNHEDLKIIEIPFKRESTFDLLPHEENGYVGGSWKDITTRYNQMKYYNEITQGHRDPNKDGLNNCYFKELNYININRLTQIIVSI